MYTDRKSGFAVQIRLRILIFGLCGRNGEFMHKTEQEGLKYQKLYNWAHTLITSGVIKNMDKFPSETSLQKKFGYSRQTVRTALRQLEEEGLITRVRGSGTYVSYDSSGVNGERPQIGLLLSYYSDYLFPRVYDGIEATM
jgi:GntR family transcriptional regulator, arabinose operon transcriptional repressor